MALKRDDIFKTMTAFTKAELEESNKALLSTLKKCEKVQDNADLGKSQKTLLERRIAALRVALALVERELKEASDLTRVLRDEQRDQSF